MSKRILQDVVTSSSNKKTVGYKKNVVKNSNRESSIDVRMPSTTHKMEYVKTNSSSDFSRFAIWVVAAGTAAFLFFVLLSFFSGTVVKIVPLQKEIIVDGNFFAQKNPEEYGLPFKLIVLEDSLSGEVPTTEEKEVEKKASGNIVIYNTYSSKHQKLIKRTRFETSDGKIYRINKSVIVPGSSVQEGEMVPGSVEVTVYADIPGEEYNIDLTDFTIPGFKGDPRFDKFYARSKTPMKDGFSGTVKIASPEDVTNVEEGLQNSLKETLLMQARSQVPGEFLLYDDAVFFSFKNENNLTYSTKDSVEITESGYLYGVLLNKSELSKDIAINMVTAYNGSDVSAKGIEDLNLKVSEQEKFDPTKDTNFDFTLSGPVTIIWEVDETALARDLAGTNKVDFLNTIGGYSNIQKAEAIIRPFWKKTFPEDSNDITIKVIGPTSK